MIPSKQLWPPAASLAFLRQHPVFCCPSLHSLPHFSFPVCSPPSCFSACFYLFNNSSCFCHLFFSLLLLSPSSFVLQVFPLISDRSFFSIFFLSICSFFISVHRPPPIFSPLPVQSKFPLPSCPLCASSISLCWSFYFISPSRYVLLLLCRLPSGRRLFGFLITA